MVARALAWYCRKSTGFRIRRHEFELRLQYFLTVKTYWFYLFNSILPSKLSSVMIEAMSLLDTVVSLAPNTMSGK